MFDLNTTDRFSTLSTRLQSAFPRMLPLLQRQQVLPPPNPDSDYIAEFDSTPIDLNDFIESVSDGNQVDHFNHYTTTTFEETFNNTLHAASVNSTSFTQRPYVDENSTYPSSSYEPSLYGPIYLHMPCEDVYSPDNPITIMEFWVCGICINVVGILGIIGHIISMNILSRPQMRSSILI